jgi:NO-binding membrane sensor protein with MHYT domain
MGGIAIWCMHYISNRAIVLGDGQSVIHIAYSPGFTVLSFFVPILVLLTAFTTLGSGDRVGIVRVTVGGTLAGLAICGMHYLGQAGISNYTSVYRVENVVGSAIVAVAASIVALWVFFVLRTTWTNSWWKRALCAVILAGAVFGMHWLASLGTQYRLKKVDPSFPNEISRNSTVIVVIVLVSTTSLFQLAPVLILSSLLLLVSFLSFLRCLHRGEDLSLPTELSRWSWLQPSSMSMARLWLHRKGFSQTRKLRAPSLNRYVLQMMLFLGHVMTYVTVSRRHIWSFPSFVSVDLSSDAQLEQCLRSSTRYARAPLSNVHPARI